MYFIEMYAFALYESRVCRDIHVSCNLKTLTTNCNLSSPRRKTTPKLSPSLQNLPSKAEPPLLRLPSPQPQGQHPQRPPPTVPLAPYHTRPPTPAPSLKHALILRRTPSPQPTASFRIPMRDPSLPNGDGTHPLRPQHHRLGMSTVYGRTERKRHAAIPARITTLAACFDGAHLGCV